MLNYKLLTPGPLSTTNTVKQAMLVDHCTWDDDYKNITQEIRQNLLDLAQVTNAEYTCVLMQGSGSFGVESVISSAFNTNDKVLMLSNGAYGERAASMLKYAGVDFETYAVAYDQAFDLHTIETILASDKRFSHIVVIHCETTTGILNDIESIGQIAAKHNKTFIVDAMSSFGGMQIPLKQWHIDFLISSANKCIQGVPGFSFIIARRECLKKCEGQSRTLSLDLYKQWQEMEKDGKWRFTSPTHVVLAFAQALKELSLEGGINARYQRYAHNNKLMRQELAKVGINAYISEELQSPFITTFLFPNTENFNFTDMYNFVKEQGYAIYPGKLTEVDTFRLGNIGEIYEDDVYKVSRIITNYLEKQSS